MKRYIRWKWLLFILSVSVMLLGNGLHVKAGNGKYNGGIVLDEDANPIKTEQGLMPSKGDVDVLVVMVEFQDVKHDSVHTQEYMKQLFIGASPEQDFSYAPVSLKEYYNNSSYGQLNISGDIIGWYTAEHERSYYKRDDLELPGVDMLFREVVTSLDGEIDYSKYDSDKDGYIDGIYLIYAGGTEGWGGTFWTYVSTYVTEDLVLDQTNLRKYAFVNEYENVNTISHETGHLLGLMDYYDYDKGTFGGSGAFGTDQSLMVGSVGELDALSKILLGWVTPRKVTGNTSLSLRPINEYPDVALVYAAGENRGRTFFLVESYSATKNFAGCIWEPGLRIYRVNTTLGSGGKSFQYGVTDDNEINTISVAMDTANKQSKISPYNTPSSYLLVEDNTGKAQWKATGVTIDNIVIGESAISCAVKYESISTSKKPAYTINPVAEDNRIYLELNFDVEVNLLDENIQVYAVAGQEKNPMTLLRNNYSSKRLDSYYVYTDEMECKPDTTYTITIPAGSFQSSYGAKNETITYALCTSDFPAVVAVDREGFIIDMDSQIISSKEGGLVYFSVKDGYLQKIYVSGSGVKELKPLIKLDNPTQWMVKACQLDSGNYIVYIYDNGEGALYRVDATNSCKLLKRGINSGGNAKISAIGPNAVLYNCSDGKYFLIKEDGTVDECSSMYPYDTGYMYLNKLWENRYIVGRPFTDCFYIVDSGMNVVSPLSVPRLVNFFDVMPNKQGFKFIGIEALGMGYNDTRIYSFAYDHNFNYIGKNTMPYEAISYVSHFEGGYAVAKSVDRPFFNANGQGTFSGVIASPIMHICIYDDKDNQLFSYTVDSNGTEQGDSIINAIRLSDGRIAWATDWQVYITEPYKMPRDYVVAFVERMYTVALGRAAEAEGLDFYTQRLFSGDSNGACIAESFLCSPEFLNKGYSDAEYVKVLYRTFFDREPAAEEVSYWVDKLASGQSRAFVLSGFVNSVEFDNLCTSYGISRGFMREDGKPLNPGIGRFAERLYTVVLERAGEKEGIEYWSLSMANGVCTPKDAAKSFFLSQEYINKNTSDAQYITTLYRTFMDREPEAGGVEYWQNVLNNGATREQILEGFADSAEFKGIMASFGL